jgi:methylene-tetrahydromethanopterin dehydrogenase
MQRKRILYAFSTEHVVSPFDVNVAYDAGFDIVHPVPDVTPESGAALTQDVVFSRGVSGTKATAIFVGGSDLERAEAVREAVAKAMFRPFQVPVLIDPKGAYTTAAALVAKVEQVVAAKGLGPLEGRRVAVLGGTGPVGQVAGALAAGAGALVTLLSRVRKMAEAAAMAARARYGGTVTLVETRPGPGAHESAVAAARTAGSRHGVDLAAAQAASPDEIVEALADAEVALVTVKAGVQVLPRAVLERLRALRVVADINAVPPPGVEGLEPTADSVELTPRVTGIGALAVGDLKMKVELALMRRLLESEDRGIVLDHGSALEAARAQLVRT